MSRMRMAVSIGLAGAVGLLGLSGCARPGVARDAAQQSEYDWAAQALQSIGFAEQDLPAPSAESDNGGESPSPSAGEPDRQRSLRWHRLRYCFAGRRAPCPGRNVLHGEAVVTTEEGTKTVVVQRGAVTTLDEATITVESSDGFTLTWTYGDPLHVVEHRAQIQPTEIAVGATVGVAGERQGDTTVARLIIIPRAA